MPSSIPEIIPCAMKEIMRINPQSILDLGVGFGKWGHLCREYLDVWQGNWKPEDCKVRIDGIEAFPEYITANTHQVAVYDCVMFGDAGERIHELGPYDVVLAMDMLEHQEKGDASLLMQACVAKARKAAIFSIPLGKDWLGANGPYTEINAWEAHKSWWLHDEVIEATGAKAIFTESFPAPRGPVCVFVFEGQSK